MLYSHAVTEVILQKDGGTPIHYTVISGGVISDIFDLFILGHGAYTEAGTYAWTIKATGYKDATVTVNVPTLAPPE